MSTARTRIERTFDPDAIRTLNAESAHDLTIDGPNLARRSRLAWWTTTTCSSSVVGGGKRSFPDGVRLDLGPVSVIQPVLGSRAPFELGNLIIAEDPVVHTAI
ncbi:hypothetical protein OIE74_38465 [Streptomyces sp. NBC_01716]